MHAFGASCMLDLVVMAIIRYNMENPETNISLTLHACRKADFMCIFSEVSMCQSFRSEGALDDNFSYFSSKPYVVTPHLNILFQTVQMRGHNIWFYEELIKVIPNYHQILHLIKSFVCDFSMFHLL